MQKISLGAWALLFGVAIVTLTSKAEAWIPPDYETFPTTTHTAVAVATTSTATVSAKSNRLFLILENISDTAIDCKFGAVAVASEGVRLTPNGGNLLLDAKYPTAAINCIHAGSGTKTLLVTEGAP